MFVLRKITENGGGVEINTAIGDSYTYINKEDGEIEFEEMRKFYGWDDCIYGFINCKDGARILPLSSKQISFVMTESGKTFANVSQR